QFREWVAAQRQPSDEPGGAEAVRGQAVFLRSRCAECHTVRGTPAAGDDGPDLTHVASRRTLAAATLRNTAEHLARWLRNPDAVKDGSGMPPAMLTDEDLEAVVAYLRGLE
ncbi:MAG TPA: cytochrome c, partial [Acidimicrobiales bacterium]|nr:cytochrome c [Acidimicrobiales bacterium]